MDSSSKAKLKYFYSELLSRILPLLMEISKYFFIKNSVANVTHSITPPSMKPSYQHFCESCDCDEAKKSKRIDTNRYMVAAGDRLKQNNFIKLFKNVKNKINSA